MQCSAVMELVVDGNVTPESDVVVTRKRERSDDQSEDVKKLQKEAEVKEEMRVKLRKLRGMDSSQEEGGLASSQVAAVSVAPVSASNPGAGDQVEGVSVSLTASNPGAHSIVQLDGNFETDGNSELSSDLTVDGNSDPELDWVGEMEEEKVAKIAKLEAMLEDYNLKIDTVLIQLIQCTL